MSPAASASVKHQPDVVKPEAIAGAAGERNAPDPPEEPLVLWAAPEQYLNSIFQGFPHLKRPALCEPDACEGICGLLAGAATTADPVLAHHPDAAASWGLLIRALDLIQGVDSPAVKVLWEPAYGAAVLGFGADVEMADYACTDSTVSVVALDSWHFQMHSSHDGKLQPWSVCSGAPKLMHAGSTGESGTSWESFVAKFNKLRSEREQLAKKEPQGKGLPKTPGTILWLAKEAVHLSRKPGALAGGFTDVGADTGSDEPRDTAWPLVCAILQIVLGRCLHVPNPDLTMARILTLVRLQLLHTQVTARLQAATATPAMVNACMVMMQHTAQAVASIADQGEDVTQHSEMLCAARQALEQLVSQRAADAAAEYALPDGPADLAATCRLPACVLPPPVQLPAATASTPAEHRARAADNLRSLPVPPVQAATLAATLQLAVSLTSDHSNAASQLVLRAVERTLFTFARQLTSPAGIAAPVTVSQLGQLTELVDRYNEAMERFLAGGSGRALMQTEQRSRQVLVAWSAYCLMHAAVCGKHAELAEHGVSLHWGELRHMVLSDRDAVDTALAVATYLCRHTRSGKEVFAAYHGCTAATPAFALQFAEHSRSAEAKALRTLWKRERENADARREGWWRAVQDKQQRVKALQAELHELQTALTEAENKSTAARSKLDGAYKRAYDGHAGQEEWMQADAHYNKCERKRKDLKEQVANKKKEIERERMSPAGVIQPLPHEQDKALVWLFFLHMPVEFRHLSRMSYLAQQLMLPRPVSCIIATHPKRSLTAHYNTRQACDYAPFISQQRGSDGGGGNLCFVTDMRFRVPSPQEIPPKTVDGIFSADQGVWHPDELQPTTEWTGSKSAADKIPGLPHSAFNPFATLPPKERVDTFTERLAAAADDASLAALQWAMPQYGTLAETDTNRSNLPIANQHMQPSWLSKPGWLAFGGLRSYPLGQLRRLCEALRGRLLPWSQPAVAALVRQTLFHVGEMVGDGEGMRLLWRTGWDQPDDVLKALELELSSLADELQDKAREHDSVLHLGEMAAYLSAWHPPLVAVARRFARIASIAADHTAREIRRLATGNEKARQQLQAKQLFLRMVALLCYGNGTLLDMAAIAHMCKLCVLINHGNTFLEPRYFTDPQLSNCLEQLTTLHARCSNLMATRLPELVSALESRPEYLTRALREVIEWAPAQLRWQNVAVHGSSSGSFEAVSSDGHLFSLNVLDGTVLVDGLPPGRLPKAITEHRLFKRVFGANANLEVAPSSHGKLRTTRAIGGRFYEFLISTQASSPPAATRAAATPRSATATPATPVAATSRGHASGHAATPRSPPAAPATPPATAARPAATATTPAAPGSQTASGGEAQQPVQEPELRVWELELQGSEEKVRLELLDVGADMACGKWGRELPVRLRNMHSHWLRRADGTVVLRGISFLSRETYFIARVLTQAPASLACQRVPPHLRAKHWSHLLQRSAYKAQLTDTFVVHNSALLHVLSKFENPSFVHTYTRQQPAGAAGPSSAASDPASQQRHSRPRAATLQPRIRTDFEPQWRQL